MTQEEKARAYDEALERIKELYSKGSRVVVSKEEFENIFPELAESKDEKIRKAILTGLIDCRDAPDLGWSDFGGIVIDDCIDWIEKQAPKPKWSEEDENMLESIICHLQDGRTRIEFQYEIDWLKSIKQRMEEQK